MLPENWPNGRNSFSFLFGRDLAGSLRQTVNNFCDPVNALVMKSLSGIFAFVDFGFRRLHIKVKATQNPIDHEYDRASSFAVLREHLNVIHISDIFDQSLPLKLE